jgi:SAM-dependent methyltransferase
MHPITAAVRDLYARYPYPSTPVTLRVGFDVRRSLSFAEVERPPGRLRVLDAGCSHGAGLLGMAAAQPDVDFLGVDVNPVALERGRAEAARRGLANVRFAEVDLETLEGLEVPGEGFDLIVCSGVVHHLVDPATGLARLAGALAPWGVLDLMVYARAGRVGIESVAAALARQVPEGPVEERVARARAVVEARRGEPDWDEAASVDDVEFADRYLHPRFQSYDLDGLDRLLEAGGLRFLRWNDAARWDPWCLPDPRALEGLTGRARDAAVEARVKPRTYDLLAVHRHVAPRAPVADPEVAVWALNPEGELRRGRRVLWTGARDTGVVWTHPSRETLPLSRGPAAVAAPFLVEVDRPFAGRELVAWCIRRGVPAAAARQLLVLLERLDVLWRPHAVDLQGRPEIRTAA